MWIGLMNEDCEIVKEGENGSGARESFERELGWSVLFDCLRPTQPL